MAYTLPDDIDARPIAIIGAGTLGRRIAAMYAAGGSEVRIVDPAEDQRASARDFVSANAEGIRRRRVGRGRLTRRLGFAPGEQGGGSDDHPLRR